MIDKRELSRFLTGKDCLTGCGGRLQMTEHKVGDEWVISLSCLKCKTHFDLDKIVINYDAQKSTN